MIATFAWADPPTNARDLAEYTHDKEWLSHYPASFVATNIRGDGMQYAARRQAALDLVKTQRDFGVVSELTAALNQKSFLSDQICDLLGDWKAKRALPDVQAAAKDASRDKAVRDKCALAATAIDTAKPDRPPVFSN
jgi:hypothetical protein